MLQILFFHSQRQDQKKNKSELKRTRDAKDTVMNKLFEVFEKHQYYNIQDLVRLTSQPIVSSFTDIIIYHLGPRT